MEDFKDLVETEKFLSEHGFSAEAIESMPEIAPDQSDCYLCDGYGNVITRERSKCRNCIRWDKPDDCTHCNGTGYIYHDVAKPCKECKPKLFEMWKPNGGWIWSEQTGKINRKKKQD
jgi:hypothetical protein